MAKVIHVHLLHNIGGTKQKDWYFSSISAVYTVLTAEQVGATKNYLLPCRAVREWHDMYKKSYN